MSTGHGFSYVLYLVSILCILQCVVQVLTVNVQRSSEWGYLAGRTKQLDKLNNYDITIPYRLEGRQRRSTPTLKEDGHLKEATFVIEVNGDEVIIDLKLNVDLFPAKFIQRSYLPDGRLLTRKPHKLHHCYYHGEVRNSNFSAVALSTCNGLSGVIIMDGKTYYVEPLSDSKYEHLIYTPDNVKRKMEKRVYDLLFEEGVNDEPDTMHQQHRAKRDVFDETKYVELFIVADYTEYTEQGRDKEVLFTRCKEMANAMDLIYRPLNMRIALIGVEVWDEGDMYEVSTNPTAAMQAFHRWRKEFLIPDVYNDNAQFVTGKSFDGSTVGMASLNAMCSLDRSGGVNEDHGVNAADVASTMAHEMGHNMGFVHDSEEKNCICEAPSNTGCVMEPSSGSIPPTIFSSCTEDDFKAALLRGLGACLFNYPKTIFHGPHCGNGFLEKGEECDCGNVEDCTNDCCQPETCTLHENATCANGECCEDCQLKEAGVQCRDEVNQCDLPEYCTGINNECPGNVYRQNGEACSDMAIDEAVCYNGQCVTYDDQCRSIWGQGATKAHDVCFNFNKRGTNFGNCGVDDSTVEVTYTPCSNMDIKCGKLMCKGGADFPIMGSLAEASIGYQYDAQNVKHPCKSASIDLGEDIPDPGYVSDGSLCGFSSDQFCVEARCQNKSNLNIGHCPFNCYNRGVCNSQNHCHCDPEWAPPVCKSPGYGGSIDSGPARPQGDLPTVPPLTTSVNMLPDFTDHNKDVMSHNSSVISLLVVFLVVVPALVIGGIAAYVKRRQLQQIIRNKRFSNFPKETSRADVTNGHPTNKQTSRPDIVMNTSSVTYDTSKSSIDSGFNKAPRMQPVTVHKPAKPSPQYSNVVRQDSFKKPIKPPPPVPETTSASVTQPSPVRKAPTKPPQLKPTNAPPRPPESSFSKPSSEGSSETNRPQVALRPPISRPPPVPKPKWNANNSAEPSSSSITPATSGGQAKPPRKPVPAPRPESLRLKNVSVPKQRPAIPRRPSSTSGNPSA